jgi:hypothetical protein
MVETALYLNYPIKYLRNDNKIYFSLPDIIKVLFDPINELKYYLSLKHNYIENNSHLFDDIIKEKVISKNNNRKSEEFINSSEMLSVLGDLVNDSKKSVDEFKMLINNCVNNKQSYILKHKNIDVIEITIDETGNFYSYGVIYNYQHLPSISINSGVFDFSSLREWWKYRVIPDCRENLKELLESLNINSSLLLLQKSLGLSLSDHYWISPIMNKLNYNDINYYENEFDPEIGRILFGKTIKKDKKNKSTSPDTSTDGMLIKRWEIIDSKRYLIKGFTNSFYQEVQNEILASEICKRLNINHVPYGLISIDGIFYNTCPDFIDLDTELITTYNLISNLNLKMDRSLSFYEQFIKICENLGIKNVRSKMEQMITLDFIISNTDRHLNNLGVIRNPNTLEFLDIAPIYDSGTSMWCTTYDFEINYNEKNIKSKPFRSTHIKQIELVRDFSFINFDLLNGIDDFYYDLLVKTSHNLKAFNNRYIILTNALKNRIKYLKKIIESRN